MLSFLVSQRRAEIGIRMVLGATGGKVRRLVIGQGLRPVLAGLTAGMALAGAAPQLLSSLLFGAAGSDVPIFAGAFVLLLTVGVFACLVPAWRAARVDPLSAMRDS